MMTIDKNLWAEEGHVNEDQFRFIYDVIQDLQPVYALETGFCSGRSSYAVLDAGRNHIKKMISIDINLDYMDVWPASNRSHEFMMGMGRKYKEILESHYKDNDYHVIEGSSLDVLNDSFFYSNFPNGVDFFFVDGDHSYRGCLSDIEAALPHMNKGGIIMIDDYKSGPPNGCVAENVNQACDFVDSSHTGLSKQTWHCRGKGICLFTKLYKRFFM